MLHMIKKFSQILVLISLINITFIGCGKEDSTDNAVNGNVVAQPNLPPPPYGQVVPTGNYNCYGGVNCGQCPVGYIFEPQTQRCVVTGVNGGNCPSPNIWNGWACVPNNFNLNCPPGSVFSYELGGCQYGNYPFNLNSNCSSPFELNMFRGSRACIYYYTTGAPSQGYYFNGFGWNYRYRSSYSW